MRETLRVTHAHRHLERRVRGGRSEERTTRRAEARSERRYLGSHRDARRARAALVEGLRAADLVCLTLTDSVPAGWLAHPPIDHVCASASSVARASVVEAWDGTAPDGLRLSDHSALVVELHGPS